MNVTKFKKNNRHLQLKKLLFQQIDIYATKSETGKISFNLHTVKSDLRPNVWHQSLYSLEDITIKAHGEHFTGEEQVCDKS